jgi:lipoprotein NlpD
MNSEYTMQMAGKTLLFGALLCFLAGCGTHQPAPVEERPPVAPKAPPPVAAKPAAPSPAAVVEVPTYTVKKGDTLYFIALDHGQDYKDIAAWNNIDNADRISVGQVLKVGPPNGAAPAPVSVGPAQVGVVTPHSQVEARPIGAPGTPILSTSSAPTANATGPSGSKNWPKTGKEAYSDQAATAAANSAAGAKPGPQVAKADTHPDTATGDDDRVDWGWPVHGKMLGAFSESTNKGIDIAAKTGDPVIATASGKVVYSGSGLRGYGKLIVIKHNATYFSAYAHNNEILVKEGQLVVKGQKIAEVGSTDADQPMLHFEIRKQGKPVDPLKYLPTAG